MKNFIHFIIFGLVSVTNSQALVPDTKLLETQHLGYVKNYVNATGSVMLSSMPSDFSFPDLTPENVKAIDKAHDLKRDYGKMFGFNDWKVSGQKLLDEKSDRILVIEGHYKNDKGLPVSFLEVYWANAQNSRQFLITSEKQTLSLNAYQEFLIK